MASIADIPCITSAFQGLPNATLNSLSSALAAANSVLAAQKLVLQSQQAALAILLEPVKLSAAAAQAAVSATTNQLNIFPNSAVMNCSQLGQLSTTLNQVFTAANNSISEQVSDLNMLLALGVEQADDAANITKIENFLAQVQASLAKAQAAVSTVSSGANVGVVIGGQTQPHG